MTTTAIREQADRLLAQLEEAKQELEGLEFTPATPKQRYPAWPIAAAFVVGLVFGAVATYAALML